MLRGAHIKKAPKIKTSTSRYKEHLALGARSFILEKG